MNEIKALRKGAQLTQKALSELLNIPKRTIENWESEVNKPPTYLVELIEYFLRNENYIKMEDMKMTKVNVYENNGGMILAVVLDGERAINIIGGFEDGALSTAEFVEAAQGGFEYADEYEPENFGGFSIEEATESIESGSDLIAEVTANDYQVHTNKIGIAGSKLFSITIR